MHLSTKIYLAIAVVSGILCLSVVAVHHRSLTSRFEADFIEKHQLLANAAARAFEQAERRVDSVGVATVRAAYERDARDYLTTGRELEAIAAQAGAACVNLFDRGTGRLKVVSQETQDVEKIGAAYSLYDLCPDYEENFSRAGYLDVTPFLPSIHNVPSKFFKLGTADNTRIIEVAFTADDVVAELQKIVAADNDVISVNVYTPTGITLSESIRPGAWHALHAESNARETWLGVRPGGGVMQFAQQIAPTIKTCCQCVGRGFAPTADSYFYRMSMTVSTAGYDEGMKHIRYQTAGLAILCLLLSAILARFVVRRQDLVDAERLESIAHLSAQVAHDIRSPLAALNAVALEPRALPEDVRHLTLNAISRVQDIATLLLDHYKALRLKTQPEPSAELENTMLSSLVDSVVAEQRMRFKNALNVKIRTVSGAASYGVFCRTQPRELKRVLSNLVTNAVESLDKSVEGKVGIDVRADQKMVHIRVIDNGAGIPDAILKRLGEKGLTYGKPDGSGMGLFHAFETIPTWGGKIRVGSKEGRGTTVSIELPRALAPAWFLESLDVAGVKKVAILDDELVVHDMWDDRLSTAVNLNSVAVHHLSTPDDLRGFIGEHGRDGILFLIDYELLGHRIDGLGLIEECGIAASSVLVTSRFEERTVVEGCMKAGVCLVPKPVASHVPIVCTDPSGREFYDAVLIDDDDCMHDLWRRSSQNASKRLLVCKSVAEFYRRATNISVHTPIYVDQDLDDGVKGIDVARAIHHRGFKVIYLATGHDRDEFSLADAPWIQEVLSKDPPWGKNQLPAL